MVTSARLRSCHWSSLCLEAAQSPETECTRSRRESSPLLPGIKPRPPSPVRSPILTELIRIQSTIKFKEMKQAGPGLDYYTCTSHPEAFGSIECYFLWDSWVTKWHWVRFFSRVPSVPPSQYIIPAALHSPHGAAHYHIHSSSQALGS
jgi:hypothetical protein